jgi:hypothetical protein
MTFSITLGKSSSLPNAEALWAEKQKNWVHPWERKMGYGPGVLSVGREAGSNLLGGLKLNRANLNVNIDKILEYVYETSLEDALII